MFIFVKRDGIIAEKVHGAIRIFQEFNLSVNCETAIIDEYKSSQIRPEDSGVF